MPGTALIAGGGIGGLAAALALARTGWGVEVLERAPILSEVGAGLQLGPNAMRVLDRLGVGAAVAEAGFRPRAAVIRLGQSGTTVFRMGLGEAIRTRHGAPYIQIHRADLQGILARAAEAAGARLTTGVAVTGFTQTAAAVTLAGEAARQADLLIGADGLRSAVQAALIGPAPARFTGQACWRATLATADLPPGLVAPDATVWVGPGAHAVTYYLRGGALVNLVAVIEMPGWTREEWSEPGDPAALRAAFRGWHPDLTGLLDRVGDCALWALCDRPPLPRWTDGRVALLGDACHPMLPFLAQGAAMAIEDAGVLAACLTRAEVRQALARYASLRHPRATRVQAGARANAGLFHRRSLAGRIAGFGPMALATHLAPFLLPPAFDWLYGRDVWSEGES